MICPRCSCEEFLEKNYEDVRVDMCSSCEGVWLDEGEIREIVFKEDKTFSKEMIKDVVRFSFAGTPKSETKEPLLCPICSQTMDPINYAVNSGVIIDRCPQGEGLWFDRGELEKAQAWREYWRHEMKGKREDFLALLKRTQNEEPMEDEKHSVLFSVAKFFGNLK